MPELNRSNSRSHFARACKSIPGGVNSPARAFGAVGGVPAIIDRGEGASIFDIDGNQYTDYIGSWGPHILGHKHEAVHRMKFLTDDCDGTKSVSRYLPKWKDFVITASGSLSLTEASYIHQSEIKLFQNPVVVVLSPLVTQW